MDRKLRLKLITKLAQSGATPATAATAPTTPPTASAPATPPVAPPPQLDVWGAYPEAMKGYNSSQVNILNGLVNRLSNAVNQTTGGKYNFQVLRTSGFQFDPSALPDASTKNLMNFFLKVYKFLLNGGNAFPTAPIDPKKLSGMLNMLSQAPELNALGTSNATGPVANQAPGNNDMAQTIRNSLQAMQPTVATRPV